MKVLGIDPGMNACGWAVLDGEEVVDCGTIRTKPADDPDARVRKVLHELQHVHERQAPCRVVCEGYRDQGAARKQFNNRWQTPMVIGAIVATFRDVVLQDPSVVAGRHAVMRDYVDGWMHGVRLIGGDEMLFGGKATGHVRDAAAHALYYVMKGSV